MRWAMIMAGGSGSRLWPMSRAATPKQLLPLIVGDDGRPTTLLALSASRLEGLVEPQRRSICTGERFRAQVRDAAPGILDEMILGEPMGRDTVNAVALAAAAFEKRDPDAVFAVLTADHVIEPTDVFQRCVRTGFELVEDDPRRFVTFAITPTYPATGFGYVERGDAIEGRDGAFEVARFVEKPDLARATEYLESGTFGWNAGMFVFHAGTVLDALERFVPESHTGIREIQRAMGTPDEQRTLERVYPTLPKTSVDYGIMEPASASPDFKITGVDMPVRWLDVGSWPAVGETREPDEHGNVVGPGAALAQVDSAGNLVAASTADGSTHTVALLGCRDLVVVSTPGATLVMPKDRAQDLKDLHGELPEELR